jgi:SAM-dependent methyltransferase
MRSVVVDSTPSVIQAVLSTLDADPPRHFVDFGCGRGVVLSAVAARFPGAACLGVDIDSGVLEVARQHLRAAAVDNVTLKLGDAVDSTDEAADVAYLYVGGALNQRLGHALLERRRCRRVLAVRYPIIGAIPVRVLRADESDVYVYDPEAIPFLVEWDFAATEITVPRFSSYLLSRALRVLTPGVLTLESRTWHGATGASVQSAEFGLRPARPGVPVICDILIRAASEVSRRAPTVIEVRVAADGVPLVPTHLIAVTTTSDAIATESRIADQTRADQMRPSRAASDWARVA